MHPLSSLETEQEKINIYIYIYSPVKRPSAGKEVSSLNGQQWRKLASLKAALNNSNSLSCGIVQPASSSI